MNDKLPGIEKKLNDTTQDLARKVKKSENTLKFKGNQVQFELNVDIQDNLNSALKYIKCDRSKPSYHFNRRVIGRFEKTQQIDTHSGQVGRGLEDY